MAITHKPLRPHTPERAASIRPSVLGCPQGIACDPKASWCLCPASRDDRENWDGRERQFLVSAEIHVRNCGLGWHPWVYEEWQVLHLYVPVTWYFSAGVRVRDGWHLLNHRHQCSDSDILVAIPHCVFLSPFAEIFLGLERSSVDTRYKEWQ